MNVYVKWGFIVAFNTAVCVLLAQDFMKTIPSTLGIIVGIGCFILLYVKLDLYLLNTNKNEWHKALIAAAILSGVLSFYPAIPMISGSIAIDLTSFLLDINSYGIRHNGFIPTFFITILTGVILSSLVILLALLFRFMFYIKPKPVKIGVDND